MSEHSHHDHDHSHDHPHPAPDTPVDAGSQALAEALRSSFAIVKVVMVLLVLVFLASGFFQVGPQEQAIILRFGKPVGEGKGVLLGPGLHWSLPYPIDEHVKVPITGLQQVRSTTGWYATTDVQEAAGTEPPPGPSLNPIADGYAVTADGNIIHLRATVFYRIENPIRYEFGFTNTAKVVQNMLDDALLQTAAQFKVDEILTTDVARFNDAVTLRVRQLVEQNDVGISVDRCVFDRMAPRQLKAAFDRVVSAGQAQRTSLNEARKYENQVISKAIADSQSITNAAEAERVEYVKGVNSLAANFEKILKSPEYSKNPDLFVQQRLYESLGRSLTNAEKWVLPTTANGKGSEVRLLLNREPPKPKAPPQQ